MKAPDKCYITREKNGVIYSLSLNDNGGIEYIRKDALIEWAKELNEAYHKKYEESNYTCGEHWGQMVAFRRIIDKLNLM